MTPTELPAWIKVGAVCPLIGGRAGLVVGHATIEKVNKRFIVAGGRNYSLPRSSKDRIYRTGEAGYHTANLFDPDCEVVRDAAKRTQATILHRKVRGQAEAIMAACRYEEEADLDVIADAATEILRLVDVLREAS